LQYNGGFIVLKELNQKGIAFAQTLLIVIALGLVGGTGYYVYHANQTASKTLDSASQNNQPDKIKHKKAASSDPTAAWTSYKSPQGQFSLKYPTAWQQPSAPGGCASNSLNRTLSLGPDANSVAKCGTDNLSQIMVTGTAAAPQSEDTRYDPIARKDVVVDGVKGQRITGKTTKASTGLGGYPIDTIVITYLFSTKGYNYTATYIQTPAGQGPSQDVQADFDLMITKTLKFE
jgi:hypothetical protein